MEFYPICYQMMCGFCYFFASLPGFPVLVPGQPASTSQHPSLVLGPTSTKAPWSLCLSTTAVLLPCSRAGSSMDGMSFGGYSCGREAHLVGAVITSSVTPFQFLYVLIEMVKSTDKRVLGISPPPSLIFPLQTSTWVCTRSPPWSSLGHIPGKLIHSLESSWMKPWCCFYRAGS